MKHACYMSVENDCNIRLTCMLPCACYCLLDACNMHVTCALFRIGHLYSPVYNRMIILEYAGLCVTYTCVGVFGYFCMVVFM